MPADGAPRHHPVGRLQQRPDRAAREHLSDEEPQVSMPLTEQARVLAQGEAVQLLLAGRTAVAGTIMTLYNLQ